MSTPDPLMTVQPEVAAALAEGRPVVALESTVIAHGLPWPENLTTARKLESVIRNRGAVPATVCLADGRIRVGSDDTLLERLARSEGVHKTSRRDMPGILARGGLGATTVAGSLVVAALAKIPILATGGIGGVHRGGETSMDVSADLAELARSDVAVVCAGAKAILDLGRTLEVLETLGVPVVGYGIDRFPAFYSRDSGLTLEERVDDPAAAARLMLAKRQVGLSGGVVFAVPPPEHTAMDRVLVEGHVATALAEAQARGVAGKRLTPFLLERIRELSSRKSLMANLALLEQNAAVAGDIAVALSRVE